MQPLAFLCIAFAITPPLMQTQQPHAAIPEIARLAKTLVGDWNTVETMERSTFFPNGGSRHGIAHVRLVAGGTTLLYEVQSDGTAGRLDGFLTIWWDKGAKLYRVFTCFNSPDNPCQMRGTAHWEAETLVYEYDERVNGKPTRWRDSFTEITPMSYTLTAAMEMGNGAMQTFITTRSTRR